MERGLIDMADELPGGYRLDVDSLPLVLAGPILRRTEPGQVTVWVALKEACAVSLHVFELDAAGEKEEVLTASLPTTALGAHLHLAAVRAKAGTPLKPGTVYYYDLTFVGLSPATSVPPRASLSAPGILNAAGADDPQRLDYDGSALPLPSFALPPEDLNHLRLVHSSCRKPHGEGEDMLALLDDWIGQDAADALKRPHQLFLTGDQIYADDVADALLAMLTVAGEALLEWKEELPGIDDVADAARRAELQALLQPGRRQELSEDLAHFSSGDAASHLFRLGEFYAMYLFTWSRALWPSEFGGREIGFFFPDPGEAKELSSTFSAQKPRLNALWSALPRVRRALANVPTYMMFDDHEITDDLYLTASWVRDALGSGLGRRVVLNGFLALALFQAWGNTPDLFDAGVSPDGAGVSLLRQVHREDPTPYREQDYERFYDLLGMPGLDSLKPLDGRVYNLVPRAVRCLEWHYRVGGPRYEALVLDTRTQRSFGGDYDGPPFLLGQMDVSPQIPARAAAAEVTFVVAPSPVADIGWVLDVKKPLTAEFGDWEAWESRPGAVQELLSRLLDQGHAPAIFLSGDVHYGFAARVRYKSGQRTAAFAQLTASAQKNEDWKPRLVHNWGYSPRGTVLLPTVESVTHPLDGTVLSYRADYIRENHAEADAVPRPQGDGWLQYFKDAAAAFRRWFEDDDGKEAVGHNNVGEVRLEWNGEKLTVQTLHWTQNTPGGPTTTYRVPLDFEDFEI
jgi:hypothetical protein